MLDPQIPPTAKQAALPVVMTRLWPNINLTGYRTFLITTELTGFAPTRRAPPDPRR
jgi:hypothetical protein